MNLESIGVDIVRNEYEYNKYVSEEYRKKYDYEASKASLPWIIVRFNKGNSPEDLISECEMEMSPVANFANISAADPTGAWEQKGSILKMDLTKIKNALMLKAKKDCGFNELPATLTVTVRNSNAVPVKATYKSIDLSKPDDVLKQIDDKLLQGGGANTLVGQLLYELVASSIKNA
jgi:hypothetical protein